MAAPTVDTDTTLLRRQLALLGGAALMLILCLSFWTWAEGVMRQAPAAHASLRAVPMAPGASSSIVVPVPPAHDAMRNLEIVAIGGLVAVAVVLGLSAAHAVRVATFTFRRGDR